MSEDHSQHIAVVWPTNWPVEDPESHVTIIYLGLIDDAQFSKVDLWDALTRIKWPMLTVETGGVEMFGPNEDIPVVTIDSVMVNMLQQKYVDVLAGMGIESASEYTEYRPHITIQDYTEGIIIPKYVNLSTPDVWWGDSGRK